MTCVADHLGPTDTLKGLPVGASLSIEPVVFGSSDATSHPDGVTNWDFFQGALLAIGVRRAGSQEICGSGFMVAPGLALSATHVLRGHLDEIMAGSVFAFCVGIRTTGLDLWKIRSVSLTNEDDLAYLSLELMSAIDLAWRFSCLGVTTRCPTPSEAVTIFGFRFEQPSVAADGSVTFWGDLFAAAGAVRAVYPERSVYGPVSYPSIEIACGSLGGMSGGVLLDRHGLAMGLVSRGLGTDGDGVTWASWLVGSGLNRHLAIPWPPGTYPHDVHILDIPDPLLRVEGREAIERVNSHQIRYRVWY